MKDSDQTMDELVDGPTSPRTDLSSREYEKESGLEKTPEAPKFADPNPLPNRGSRQSDLQGEH
jgi:hypothetical protein